MATLCQPATIYAFKKQFNDINSLNSKSSQVQCILDISKIITLIYKSIRDLKIIFSLVKSDIEPHGRMLIESKGTFRLFGTSWRMMLAEN